MRSIPFKAHHLDRVLDGTKVATMRPRRMRVEPREPLILKFGRAGSLLVVVRRVSYVALGDLVLDDATIEAHESVASLRAAMESHYPDRLNDQTLVTIIRWNHTDVRRIA